MPSAFVNLIKPLITAQYPSFRDFIRAAEPGRGEGSGVAYLSQVLRDKKPKPPPLDRVPAWGRALGFTGAALRRLEDLAAIAHLPPAAQARFVALVDRQDDMEAREKSEESTIAALRRRVAELEKGYRA